MDTSGDNEIVRTVSAIISNHEHCFIPIRNANVSVMEQHPILLRLPMTTVRLT
jgi:hypothetical protein